EAGAVGIEIEAFDAREEFGETLRLLEARAREKGLELTTTISPQVPAWVAGDAGRIRPVLVNLVNNAIKFTAAGSVRIDVEWEVGPSGTELHVSVKDTGVGIPADRLASVFDPFTQADSSATRRFGGVGLGLSISSQLIAMMGGRIWVE